MVLFNYLIKFLVVFIKIIVSIVAAIFSSIRKAVPVAKKYLPVSKDYVAITVLIALFLLLFTSNLIFQLFRKPSELIGLLRSGVYKTTGETWDAYGELCRKHSTYIMTPHFLCAMAQVESSGNQFATPHWRWRWTTDISEIYAPASSAVGLMQYTDGAFEEAKKFCIDDHEVAFKGRFFDLESCWPNFFYTRLSPSDSIEMTSARLHYYIEDILEKYQYSHTSLKNKQKLAAVIHLCGLSKARTFVKNHFSFDAISPCGSHSPAVYYGRIEIIMNALERIDTES